MEAISFLSSFKCSQESIGETTRHREHVWAIAMQAVLIQRSLWQLVENHGKPDSLVAFLNESAFRLSVVLAEDAHASLRDEGWQARQAQQRAELSAYVQLIQLAAPTFDDEILILEVFADALVLAAWLVEVDFFAPLRTPSERAVQLQESVLALAPRGTSQR